jgi:hypothetical protein
MSEVQTNLDTHDLEVTTRRAGPYSNERVWISIKHLPTGLVAEHEGAGFEHVRDQALRALERKVRGGGGEG